MVDPLTGYAGTIVTEQMLVGLAQHVGSKAALQAAMVELSASLGITGTELLGSLASSQAVSGAAGGLARQVAGAAVQHGIRGAALDVLVAAAPAVAPAAASTGIAAWFAGLSAAAQAAALAAVFVAAAAATAGAAQVAGWASADNPTPVASGVQEQQRDDQEREAANSEKAEQAQDEASGTFDGYAVVQVSNHPNLALSVLSLERVADHQEGRSPLYLCYFLHGGNCSTQCVTTPSGNEICGEDISANLSVLSEHRGTGDGILTDAWASLCGQVSDVGPAPLAEGFHGKQGGRSVTIDWANTIYVAAPCN